MSTNLIIALTIAVAVIANTRCVVVARSASMLPSEVLKDLESDPITNRMILDEYQRYVDGWPYEKELEQSPPSAEFMRNFEKSLNVADHLTNRLDEHMKPDDEYPVEPLPTPLPLKIQPYKKSNSQYHMTICHFKICNMGRKRDTSHQRF